MATVYLIEQNTILRKTSDRLLLCKRRSPSQRAAHVTQQEILMELRCCDIDQVMLFGNIQVTTQALQELLQHGIELSLFSFTGKLLGQITPPKTKNIFLRIDQFHRYKDSQFCLKLAKGFVQKKITSMITILKGYQKHHPNSFSQDELNQLQILSEQSRKAAANDTLLGIEGAASAAYFRLFGRMLKPPWKFEGRNRRPPKDPVNAVLSYGYVIVGSQIQSLLDGAGFDPYLGFYHTVAYGRPSLALDLLEEFRHELVDRLALNLFNLGILKEEDFYSPPEGGVYLSISGKKKFFIQYEKMVGQYTGVAATAEDKGGFKKIFQQRVSDLVHLIRINKETPLTVEPIDEDFEI